MSSRSVELLAAFIDYGTRQMRRSLRLNERPAEALAS